MNSAYLKDSNHIQLQLHGYFNQGDVEKVRLYENDKFVSFLNLENFFTSEDKKSCVCDFYLSYKLNIGSEYTIYDKLNRAYGIDISFLASSNEFERKYYYEGQLGAICYKDYTLFRVFSPLASLVAIKLYLDSEEKFVYLKRINNGVFEGKIDGYHHLRKYLIYAKIASKVLEVVDPYAYSVSTNSKYGVIIDLSKLDDIPLYKENLPILKKTQAIIYECSVRDLTSLTNFKNKGTYEILTHDNLTYNSLSVGIDYIKELGVSHIQFQPVNDFQTVADDFPFLTYNWGYDPRSYFALKGSYSTDPENGFTRMVEFRKLVSTCHKKGLAVNLDVVFNHVFDAKLNALNVLCPNYFFRKNNDGSLANSTGCGNEIETRKKMFRKLIKDSISFFMDVYGIDGFRFDLMGLIDIDTMKQVASLIYKKNPHGLVYGEGWDISSNLPSDLRTSLTNAKSLKNISFFNDRFRDVLKGKNEYNNLSVRGYLTNDISYIDGFKHVFSSSLIGLAFPPLFIEPYQSVNYVECHDDACLFDKIYYLDNDIHIALRRIKLINACTILANGIAFLHMGQEFGQTKHGLSNTYNASDNYNGFNFTLAKNRKDMIEFTKDVIKVKKMYKDFSLNTKQEVTKTISFENLVGGGILIRYAKNNKEHLLLFINPTFDAIEIDIKKQYKKILDINGLINDNHIHDSKFILEEISFLLMEVIC